MIKKTNTASIARRLIVAGILVAWWAVPAYSASFKDAGLKDKRQHPEKSGDLLELLAFTADVFETPMVIEVAQPYPTHLTIAGGDNSATEVLDALIAQCAGYEWQDDAGVVVVTKASVVASPGDFMNRHLPMFVMPGDVAYLRLQLGGALTAPSEVAPLITGITPPDLTALKLHQGKVLSGLSGRQILITAAKENRQIFSFIIFPNGNPKTQKDIDEANSNWYIRSISTLASDPLYVRSMAAKPH